MYAAIDQRQVTDPSAIAEIRRRFAQEFQPRLQNAPGFISFYRVAGENNMITAVILWQDKASAAAFAAEIQGWTQALEQAGMHTVHEIMGDVVTHFNAEI